MSIRVEVSTRVRIGNLLAEAKTAWALGNVNRCTDLMEQAIALLKTLTNEKAPAVTGAHCA